MNEVTKTFLYIAIAVVLIGFVWLIQPKNHLDTTESIVGKVLFEGFTDPLAVKKVQIAKYLPDTADVIDFQVAEIDGKWCVPSQQNYPADAENKVVQVTNDIIDRKVLSVAYKDSDGGDVRDVHAMFGVVDPTASHIASGDQVAGTKVVFTDVADNVLAGLIIGKEVKGNESQRYVRIPEQNTVYTMQISTEHFSTTFEDWIDQNLLSINTFDLHSVSIQDYSTDLFPGENGILHNVLNFRSSMMLKYNSETFSDDKWQLASYTTDDPETGEPVHQTLTSGNKLNVEKLDAMRQGFDELQIVGVLKKPESIAKLARERIVIPATGSDRKIFERVGYLVQQEKKEDGTTTNNILYSKQGEVGIEMKDGVVYQLRFGDLTGTTIAKENISSDGSDAKVVTADIVDMMTNNRYLMILVDFNEALVEKPDYLVLADVPTEGDAVEIERLKEKREADKRENERRETEYLDKIAAGKKRADELNNRYADWFYIIPDAVFKRIRLTDADVVKKLTVPLGFSDQGLQNPDYIQEIDKFDKKFGSGAPASDMAVPIQPSTGTKSPAATETQATAEAPVSTEISTTPVTEPPDQNVKNQAVPASVEQ